MNHPRSLRFFAVLASLLIVCETAQPDELGNPYPPDVSVKGKTGNGQACYWVLALDKDRRQTAISQPAKLADLPSELSKDDYVEIKIKPVRNAASYVVLKTSPMNPVRKVKATAAKPGSHKVYYWVQWCNNWRESALAGPIEVSCDSPKGNTVEWDPMPGATWYNVFRTDSPTAPVGRGFFAVGLHIASQEPGKRGIGTKGPTRIVDKGKLGQTVCGLKPTPMREQPWGIGFFALATSNGESVEDHGQALGFTRLKGFNETQRSPVTSASCNRSDFYSKRGAQFLIQAENELPHLGNPSFGPGSHTETFVVENNFRSGGHSEYHWKPYGPNGWKGWSAAITARSTSWTANQHGSLCADLRCYGSGDAIPFCLDLYGYGPNNDGGDEGQYLIRAMNHRILNSWEGILAADSTKGDTKLKFKRIDFDEAGTERVIVNLSQIHQAGRISKVNNVTVTGKNTLWTSAMVGQWISFDVDTTKSGHRMWYWITEVSGPESLKFFAKTGWSDACNLGYSRFIWDPESSQGPTSPPPNSMALMTLPKWKESIAREGKYVICPGTQLGSPWKEENTLNVEPLQQKWNKGDNVQIVPGPQGYIALGRIKMKGELLAQDQASGLAIANHTNRVTNGPGIQVGDNNKNNFREGIRIILGNQGNTDGIVISGENSWDENGFPAGCSGVRRACIVVPNDIAAMSGSSHWRYPHLSWHLDKKGTDDDAMEITMPNTPPLARFQKNGKTTLRRLDVQTKTVLTGDLTIKGHVIGNAKTRGVVKFSGDGENRTFTVPFGKSPSPPIVTFNSNQFARSRLASVTKENFNIEFEQAPVKGKDNITVWWHAQW